jgi:hypothetical protein
MRWPAPLAWKSLMAAPCVCARQHGAVEASDALLAIERHARVKPVELHKIRRQDPALGRDDDECKRIRLYRKAVEAAAVGK